jgi:hypothetical protein
MKKIYSILLALTLSLTACGGRGGQYEIGDVQAMADAGAFSEELDGDVAFSALYRLGDYGLEREDLTGCAVLRSAGGTCEEGAVLILDSEEDAKTAKKALEDYVQKQIDQNESYGYRLAEIPKLKDAYIDVRGSTVLLVVASDLDAAKSVVE